MFQELYLGIGEEKTVVIEFDPAYKADNHIRLVEETLTISYKEHPHVVGYLITFAVCVFPIFHDHFMKHS